MQPPRVVVTLMNPDRSSNPELARMKNGLYLDALRRAGASPEALDDGSPASERRRALDEMDGLLITGGADVDPARYGEATAGAHAPDPGRDQLDADAVSVAWERNLPILGICRGLQVLNVVRGGSLVQHVEGHEGGAYPSAPTMTHEIGLIAGTRLATILGGSSTLTVNSFHHQAVTPDRLADGLRAAAEADHGSITLVEGLESTDPGRWVVAVQCHPERTESTPSAFDALWVAFVATASARAGGRG